MYITSVDILTDFIGKKSLQFSSQHKNISDSSVHSKLIPTNKKHKQHNFQARAYQQQKVYHFTDKNFHSLLKFVKNNHFEHKNAFFMGS